MYLGSHFSWGCLLFLSHWYPPPWSTLGRISQSPPPPPPCSLHTHLFPLLPPPPIHWPLKSMPPGQLSPAFLSTDWSCVHKLFVNSYLWTCARDMSKLGPKFLLSSLSDMLLFLNQGHCHHSPHYSPVCPRRHLWLFSLLHSVLSFHQQAWSAALLTNPMVLVHALTSHLHLLSETLVSTLPQWKIVLKH